MMMLNVMMRIRILRTMRMPMMPFVQVRPYVMMQMLIYGTSNAERAFTNQAWYHYAYMVTKMITYWNRERRSLAPLRWFTE